MEKRRYLQTTLGRKSEQDPPHSPQSSSKLMSCDCIMPKERRGGSGGATFIFPASKIVDGVVGRMLKRLKSDIDTVYSSLVCSALL